MLVREREREKEEMAAVKGSDVGDINDTERPVRGEQDGEYEVFPLDASGFKAERTADAEVGVQVRGFDLAKLADTGAGVKEIDALLLRHGVVIFRGQKLTEEQELNVARQFPHDEVFRPPSIELLGTHVA